MADLSASARNLSGYLRESGIRHETGPNDPPIPAEVRPLPYIDQWRTLTARGWYSYKLEDHSLFIFVEGEKPSFSFLPCPLEVQSLRNFASEKSVSGAEIYSSELRNEYELYLITAQVKESVVPVRFDYDVATYDERCHPVGHLHFGHNAQSRVGTHRAWTALAFGLFILRQYYPENWRTLLTRPAASSLGRKIRSGLTEVDRRYQDPIFLREVYLV